MAAKSELIILTLAARSAGVVTRAALREAGLASATIDLRLRRGQLVKVWRGLYEVPELTNDRTPLIRALEAVPGSVLSHLSAARRWGFPVHAADPGEPVHVTARRVGPRSEVPGIVVHRTRRLDEAEIRCSTHRLPITSRARTILDLSDPRMELGDRRLAHIIETQLVADRSVADELSALLDRPGQRGVPGAARLRSVLAGLLDDQPIPDSLLERRFADLLRHHRIGRFERQVRPPWYDGRRGVVDFANQAARLIVEVDGRRWHATTQAMVEDRRRDRLAAADGWLVLRITWNDLTDRPLEIVQQLTRTLANRAAPRSTQLAP